MHCEATFYNSQDTTLLTLDHLLVGKLNNCVPLSQDSNAPTMRLTLPHFKTNVAMGTQMYVSIADT